jgi:hypothetical protein
MRHGWADAPTKVSYEDRKMALLRAEPKWNDLRNDVRFRDLLPRLGFIPLHLMTRALSIYKWSSVGRFVNV